MNRFLHFFLVICVLVTSLQAQHLRKDAKAEEYITNGKNWYKTQMYKEAATAFESAAKLPEHQQSSYAWYMAGLCQFFAKDYPAALTDFEMLRKTYPESKYGDDALYHSGVIALRTVDQMKQVNGLNQLLWLSLHSKNFTIRQHARDAASYFMFNQTNLLFLNNFYPICDPSYRFLVSEAICYKLDVTGEGNLVRSKIDQLMAEGGTLTPFLQKLKDKYAVQQLQDKPMTGMQELRIAVVLPFFLNTVDTAFHVPLKSLPSLEMYEGMKVALDSLGHSLGKSVIIRAFDTRRDTNITRSLLGELDQFAPHIVLGELVLSNSRILAEWAEKNKRVLVVPLAPFRELNVNRPHVILSNASLETQGRLLAEFAWKTHGYKRCVIVYDRTKSSSSIALGFKKAADSLGIQTYYHELSEVYSSAAALMGTAVSSISAYSPEMVFAPLTVEETMGLFLAQIQGKNLKTHVFTGPEIEAFNAIDRQLYEKFSITFPSSYYSENDSVASKRFVKLYMKQYYAYPSKYAVQGYDLMLMLLRNCQGINKQEDVLQNIRNMPLMRSAHQDYWFNQRSDNQIINIIRYKEGRYEKIN